MDNSEITRDIVVATIPHLTLSWGDTEEVSKAVSKLYKDVFLTVSECRKGSPGSTKATNY